ncbi:MAG: tripartite tricarboxylate transporter substrate binding protein [Betaproteobacteria bacterium]|nr:tripartite tricarboxylate transporter substrate binding protein [Betaproteobacteria bacterium]
MRRSIMTFGSIGAALFVMTLAVTTNIANAQQKPVRVLVGLAPGGAAELVARLYTETLRVSLKQPFIIENRAGASGLIAMDALRAAPADGSVLLFAPNGGITLISQTFKNPRFDPFKDVVPIAMVGVVEVVLVVNASVKVNATAELVALAKADAQFRNFGSAPGTIPHLSATLFADAAGIDLVHIPYKGAGQVIVDILGGVLFASVVTAGEGVQHQRSGKVRILATFGAKRSPLMPAVPTMTEAGFPVEAAGWFGFYAPAATPTDVVERLGRALVAASTAPDVRERLMQAGIEPVGKMGSEVAEIMRADYANWTRAIRLAKLQPQD